MYKKHKKPSEKQLKVIALLEANPTMKPVEAARQAGYAPNTVKNLKQNIMDKPIVQSIMDNYRYQLERHGINPQRLAKKLDQLLDAADPVVTMAGMAKDKEGNIIYKEDRKTQLGAMKLLHDVYGVSAQKENPEGIKRRITLEDFEAREGIS